MKNSYRHVVLGAGVIGTAAALRIAERGDGDVLVIEQYRLGHDRGSSSDHSRIIRHAYHSAAYTALTPLAYASWEDIEQRTGLELVLKTGGLDLFEGAYGAQDLADYRKALDAASIPYELFENSEVRARFPQWRIGEDVTGMYQADGGILNIRRAVSAQVSLARELGVVFAEETRVNRIDRHGARIAIQTDRGVVAADHVTLATGSWAGEQLADLGVPWRITLSQEQVTYFSPISLRDLMPDRFPVWVYHGEEIYYGFPVYGEVGVKLARDLAKRTITPEQRSSVADPAEIETLSHFLTRHLPGAAGPELLSKVCIYDMPPDKEFIVDLLPSDPRITVAIGGSGHAGKFGAFIGEVIADLATTGKTSHPVSLVRADREPLVDPDYPITSRLSAAR